MDIRELSDRILLKELVDRVSVLGDQKDYHAQVQLFSKEGISETFINGELVLMLQGREQMAEAFGEFLKDAKTVYHFNGQQLVRIDGDKAYGTCYCLIKVVKRENGQMVSSTIGAVYQDDYLYSAGRWLIGKRIGKFLWEDKVTGNH